MEEKRNALRTGDESGIPIFVPECREDGGYKQVQCHKGNNPQPPTTHTHTLTPTDKRRFTKILFRYWLLLVCHRGRKTSTRIICSTFKGFIFQYNHHFIWGANKFSRLFQIWEMISRSISSPIMTLPITATLSTIVTNRAFSAREATERKTREGGSWGDWVAEKGKDKVLLDEN